MYRPSVTPQVCHRCRRMHVRGTGDRPVVVTVCPDCDRSRPVYWCAGCDQQITGEVHTWSDNLEDCCEDCCKVCASPDLTNP